MRWLTSLLVLLCVLGNETRAADYKTAKAEFDRLMQVQAEKPKPVEPKEVPKPPDDVRVELDKMAVASVVASEPQPVVSAPVTREIIGFGATTCGPCNYDRPRHAAAHKQHPEIKFTHYDLNANGREFDRWGIPSMPTYLIVENGKEVKRFVGSTDFSVLAAECAIPPPKAPDEPVGAISVGKVYGVRSYVKAFLDATRGLAGDSGTMSFSLSRTPKQDAEIKAGGATVLIPADLQMSWKKEGTGLRISFKPTLNVEYGILNQRVRGALLTEEQVSLDLPLMIDGRLEFPP